jgi:hypothetical protein
LFFSRRPSAGSVHNGETQKQLMRYSFKLEIGTCNLDVPKTLLQKFGINIIGRSLAPKVEYGMEKIKFRNM